MRSVISLASSSCPASATTASASSLSSRGIAFEALLADKAFDSAWIRADLDHRGALAVIPPKADRARRIPCDFHIYRWRHLIENFFCKLKAFRRIATRYDKTDQSFAAMIHLVGSALAVR
jgi:transposase